jgi:hypothetical protein
METVRTLLIVILGAGTAMAVLSYQWPSAPSTPVVAAPDPDITCAPSELDVRMIACSDGRSFRFDWEALRAFLEQPRLHLLAERRLR